MKNTFFPKLSHGWDKATNEAYKLLLEKNQIIDSLKGRIKVVRQLVRTMCLNNAKFDKEAKKLNFDDTFCYIFEGIPKEYGCNKLIKTRNRNTHRR